MKSQIVTSSDWANLCQGNDITNGGHGFNKGFRKG